MKFLRISVLLVLLPSSLLALPMMEEKVEQSHRKSSEENRRSFTPDNNTNREIAARDNSLAPGSFPQESSEENSLSTETPERETKPNDPFLVKIKEQEDHATDLLESQHLSEEFIKKKWAQMEFASTMAFLRIFDVSGDIERPPDGYSAWYGLNQGTENSFKPFRLNHPKNSIRFSIPLDENPIIKLGNEPKIIIPGKGYLTETDESIEVPEKALTEEEKRATRDIIYKTFQAFFSDSENEALKSAIGEIISPEKIETEITPSVIYSIFAVIDEKEKEEFLNAMDKFKNPSSTYGRLEPLFLELRRLPSSELLTHYQSLTETKTSLVSKVFSNGAKGTLTAAVPFLTGAAIGAILNTLLKKPFPCIKQQFYDHNNTPHFALNTLVRCTVNPNYIEDVIFSETLTGVGWMYSCQQLLCLATFVLSSGAEYYAPYPFNALGGNIVNFHLNNARRYCLASATNAIASSLIATMAAKYRSEYDNTDDVLGNPNAFGIASRSSDFGVTLGTSTGLGLFFTILFGKVIMERLQSSTYFQRVGDAWTSLRFRSTHVNDALNELSKSQTRSEQLIEQHAHEVPTLNGSLSSASEASRNFQASETELIRKILVEKINTNIEQCDRVIEALRKINTPLLPTWLSCQKIFFTRNLTPPEGGYEMVPTTGDVENDQTEDNFKSDDPLIRMEEG